MKTFGVIVLLIFFVSLGIGRYAPGASGAPPTPGATPTLVQAPPLTPTAQPVSGDPVRVQFSRGSYGATLTGTVGTKYLLWAAQGQTFTTTLSSPGTALGSLYGPDGKPLYDQVAAGNTPAVKLPVAGDYTLIVRSNAAFTVEVTIR